ncbi:hypothetical protein P4204_16715 [Pseudomonas aeruginosa]|nr:hypothetical protein [Pseudomonas aeruginosa]
MSNSAHLFGGNAALRRRALRAHLHDPNAVPEEWRTYFQKPRRWQSRPTSRTPQCAIISSCWPRTSAVPSRFQPVA